MLVSGCADACAELGCASAPTGAIGISHVRRCAPVILKELLHILRMLLSHEGTDGYCVRPFQRVWISQPIRRMVVAKLNIDPATFAISGDRE